nr:nascent polypeptide-associated complex subunit alpha, muscle-specific form-like [Manis javanica]
MPLRPWAPDLDAFQTGWVSVPPNPAGNPPPPPFARRSPTPRGAERQRGLFPGSVYVSLSHCGLPPHPRSFQVRERMECAEEGRRGGGPPPPARVPLLSSLRDRCPAPPPRAPNRTHPRPCPCPGPPAAPTSTLTCGAAAACASSGSPKPARRSPAARAAQGAGSARATGADGAPTGPQGGRAGGRGGCCPRRRPAGHVSAASPELGPRPAPLPPSPRDPAAAERGAGGWQRASHRESGSGVASRPQVLYPPLCSAHSIPPRCPGSPAWSQGGYPTSPRALSQSPTALFQDRLCLNPEPGW